MTPRHIKVSRRSATVTAQIELKPPPFSLNSLEPYMSRQTLELHWGKHHRTHVEELNRQILETELDEAPLEDIVVATYNRGDTRPGFTNAAEIWNHDFFWHSMKPGGGGRPSGDLLKLIERDFGSFELLLKEFKHAAASQFGSGWAWLTYKANRLNVGNAVNPFPSEKDNKLVVAKTPNAVSPLVWDYTPLLAIDLWEHSYYLDYENRRMDYVTTFLEKLVSWEVVGLRLEAAMALTAERARDEMRSEEQENDNSDGDAEEIFMDSESDVSDSE